MPAASADELSLENKLRYACAELAKRIRAGEPATANALLHDDPELAEVDDAAIELIYTEWVALGAVGAQPDRDSWLDGYPRWQKRLTQLLEFESAIQVDTSVANAATTVDTVCDDVRNGEAYEVIRELGRGGMGVVHLARQVRLGRLVALKTILAGEHADAVAGARFRAEAAAAARLQHPNIVQIFETGERDGLPFLALEYVAGGTLDDQLHSGPMTPTAAATLLTTLARAMQYAHDQGVVHRDLKPTNILLLPASTSADGGAIVHPKITDFGLAKTVAPDGHSTQPGAVVGTPSYMSPEQAAAGKVGPAADIYALGAILYECLTGRPPFKGATLFDTLDQVRNFDPVAPRMLQPAIPRDLETIALMCLRKDPGKRYASVGELADDLQRFHDGRPIQARPAGVLERGIKWCRRRPLVSSLSATMTVVVASALVVLSIFWQRTERARQREFDQRVQAEQRTGALAIASARLHWLASDLDAARASLAQCPPAYRTDEWRYLTRACRAPVVVILAGVAEPGPDTDFARELTYSPDGRCLAAQMRDGTIRTWHLPSGAVGHTYFDRTRPKAFALQNDERIVAARLSNANARIALLGRQQLLAWIGSIDLPTGEVTTFLDASSGNQNLRAEVGRSGVVLLSNDGRFAALGGSQTRIVDLVTQTERFQASSGAVPVVQSRIKFSNNSRYVAVQSDKDKEQVVIWDVRTGAELHSISLRLGTQVAPLAAVHPSGTHLVLRRLGAARGDDIVVRGPLPVTDVTIGTSYRNLGDVQFGSNGRTIAARGTQDNFVTIWDTATGRELLILRGQRHSMTALAFSPDGQHLAVASGGGQLAIWDVSDLDVQIE